MTPKTKRGRECFTEAASLLNNGVDFLLNWSFQIDRAETTPAEKTKEPTPMSISEVPQFSTFAYRRGKIRKSTANIATQVTTIIVPL